MQYFETKEFLLRFYSYIQKPKTCF